MWGAINGTYVNMKHLGAVLCVKYDNLPAVSSYQFRLTTPNKAIEGDFTVDLTAVTPQINTISGTAGNEVHINFSRSTADKSGVFYIPVPVGTYPEVKLEIYNNTTLISTTTFTNVSVVRRHLKVLNAVYGTVAASSSSDIETKLTTQKSVNYTAEVSNETINIPSPTSGTDRTLSLSTVASGANFTVTDNSGTSDAVENLTLATPETQSGKTPPSVSISMPATTVTLTATSGETAYSKVEAATSPTTLIVAKSVKIEELHISKGNVRIYGKVAKIKNVSGTQITVTLCEGAAQPEVMAESNDIQFVKETDGPTVFNAMQNKSYNSLQDAINETNANDLLQLKGNIALETSVKITDKSLTLDLNGYNITALKRVLEVKGSKFSIIGTGTIEETDPASGAVVIQGSDTDVPDYTTVTIGENVTLAGLYALFITPNKSNAYGTTVNVNGTLTAKSRSIDGLFGGSLYINGEVKHTSNYPIFNIGSTAKLDCSQGGSGIYAAGYAKWNIEAGAYIEGVHSGIAIKSGILNIKGGTIKSNGVNSAPTGGNSNGTNASGAAIQIESNNGYAGAMDITISGGTIESAQGYAIYEYLDNGITGNVDPTTETKVNSISVTGGDFYHGTTGDQIPTSFYLFSDKFEEKFKYPGGTDSAGFISSGTYSSIPSGYVVAGKVAIGGADNRWSVN